jgi:RND family efflux transporter MFP subunit
MSDQLSSDLASLRISRDDAPPSARWRVLVISVLVLLALGAAYVFGYPLIEAKLFKPEVEATQIAMVSPAQADVQLTSTGYVVPQRVSIVGAKIVGRIAKLHVEEGDQVKEGQLLAELEASDVQAAVRTAQSRVAQARAQVATAKAQLADIRRQAERERNLAEQGVAPAAAADDLEAQVASLEAQVAAAQANVRSAQSEADAQKVNLTFVEIRAPMEGIVVQKPSGEGVLVGPMAASILELADFSTLMVETDVPEARLHLVTPGGPAEIVLDAFPGKRYRGRIKEISPRVDRAKATVTVKVEFADSPDGVLPDMAARVSFLAKEQNAEDMEEPAKAVVPAVAIADRGGGKVVFVLDERNTVRMKPVTLGEAVGSGFELLEGPPAGTRVVRGPDPELQDGQQVKEKEAT